MTNEIANSPQLSGWMDDVKGAARRMLDGFGSGSGDEDDTDDTDERTRGKRAWGRLDMILASFDITQASLAKYKIAGYPPDVLIEVPKTVCGAYEFHRAESLIALGRHLSVEALDRFEGRAPSGWGSRAVSVEPGDVAMSTRSGAKAKAKEKDKGKAEDT